VRISVVFQGLLPLVVCPPNEMRISCEG